MRKSGASTTAHILTAMLGQNALTIRYTDRDGKVSRRAIEVLGIEVTTAGNLVAYAVDRRSGERRTFRLDRITHYTLHRGRLAQYTTPVVPGTSWNYDEDGYLVSARAWDQQFVLIA